MKKITRILVPLLMVMFIFFSIFWYLFDYDRTFTQDTLLGQARFQDLHGNSQLSAWFYDLAYNFSGRDQNVAIELTNQYKQTGNYTKAEYTLTNAIRSSATTELYAALCQTYSQQDKLLDSVGLLDNLGNPAIKAELDARRPAAPAPDLEPGFYSRHISVSLHSGGTIYYTTDGTYPTTSGPVYSGAIELPTGETTIYAIAVDEGGLVSPLTVLSYTVTGIVEPVTFTDPAMEAAIRELIHAGENATVMSNELWDTAEFTVPADAEDLSDLRLLPNLEKLTIRSLQLPSLEPLTSLIRLSTLEMIECRFPIEDLPKLAALPELTELDLTGCGLSTIAGLADAPALRVLTLSDNTIRNLEVLSTLPSLTELDLNNNAVTELTYIAQLPELQKLYLDYNAVTELSPLSACVKLSHFSAANNQIAVIDGLGSLPMLTNLNLSGNNIADVSALSQCVELKDLDLSSNAITDITALSTLTRLENFSFAENQVEELPAWPEGCPMKTINGSHNLLTSIDVLKNMNELTHIYMDYNQLTNIDALADNYCLVLVNVFGNVIEDVSALREHEIIVNYDPTAAD